MAKIYKLISPDLFPREYLSFIDPDDYFVYDYYLDENNQTRKYDSFDELIEHIQNRRRAVGLPMLVAPRQTIENYLYKTGLLPKTLFQEDFITSRTLVGDISKGASIAVALSREVFSGLVGIGNGGWATRSEANRRALACINCEMNVDLEKSVFRRGMNRLAALFTPHRNTDYDKDLKDCGVCGCPNDQKVHYSEKIIKEETEQSADEFPDRFFGIKDGKRYDCWVKAILNGE